MGSFVYNTLNMKVSSDIFLVKGLIRQIFLLAIVILICLLICSGCDPVLLPPTDDTPPKTSANVTLIRNGNRQNIFSEYVPNEKTNLPDELSHDVIVILTSEANHWAVVNGDDEMFFTVSGQDLESGINSINGYLNFYHQCAQDCYFVDVWQAETTTLSARRVYNTDRDDPESRPPAMLGGESQTFSQLMDEERCTQFDENPLASCSYKLESTGNSRVEISLSNGTTVGMNIIGQGQYEVSNGKNKFVRKKFFLCAPGIRAHF